MRLPTAITITSLALLACSSPRHEIVMPAAAPRVEGAPTPRAAPVGTELTIALIDELGTDWSVEHQLFRAVLLSDVTASDGSVVVRAGTPLYGVVTRVRSGKDAMLAIDIPGVTTASGKPAPFSAKLKDAPSDFPGADAALTRSRAGTERYTGKNSYDDPRTSEIRVPRGSRLRLELTRPLVLPY